MTKTTEELKRDMFDQFERSKKALMAKCGEQYKLSKLENVLEAYLEALRQDAASLHVQIQGENERNQILLHAYRSQQDCIQQARAEADAERNRAQAFEFANKSAGEFLQQAREKVKAQRQSIGKLKNERDNAVHALKIKDSKLQKALQELQELREVVGSTVAQNHRENASELKCGAIPGECSSCQACGFEKSAAGKWTVPCYRCGDPIAVMS